MLHKLNVQWGVSAPFDQLPCVIPMLFANERIDISCLAEFAPQHRVRLTAHCNGTQWNADVELEPHRIDSFSIAPFAALSLIAHFAASSTLSKRGLSAQTFR